jgi:hypothetical protein
MIACRKAWWTVIIMMFLAHCSFAQKNKVFDSLRAQLSKDSARIYRPKKVLPLVSLDQRNTFLETSASRNTPVNLQGIRFGVTLHQISRTGIGIYRIQDSRARIKRINGQPVDVEFRFNYLMAFYEYYFIHSKYWNLGLPLELGVGKYMAKDTALNREGTLYPMGIGVDLQFKPTRWVGLSTMGGYRFVGNNNNLVKLNNWFYTLSITVNLKNIYDDGRYWREKRRFNKKIARLNEPGQR